MTARTTIQRNWMNFDPILLRSFDLNRVIQYRKIIMNQFWVQKQFPKHVTKCVPFSRTFFMLRYELLFHFHKRFYCQPFFPPLIFNEINCNPNVSLFWLNRRAHQLCWWFSCFKYIFFHSIIFTCIFVVFLDLLSFSMW